MENIQTSKEVFVSLVNSINRVGFEKDKLLYKLEHSDFYEAPASTIFHKNVKGGLVAHSLNVYNTLCTLVKAFNIDCYSQDTIKIVSLFHDISKMNFYEPYYRNVKVYSDNGSKKDDGGKYDWKAELSYKVKDAEKRYLFGTHGQNSERILSYFTPLTEEESVALIWHHAGMDSNDTYKDLTPILNKYSLAVLLHMADFISVYILESNTSRVNTKDE